MRDKIRLGGGGKGAILRLALFGLAGLGLLLFGNLKSGPTALVHAGKPIEYWFGQLPCSVVRSVLTTNRVISVPSQAIFRGRRYGSTIETPANALAAMRAFGTNAVPFLLARLERRERTVHRLVEKLSARAQAAQSIYTPAYPDRCRAVTGLLSLGALPPEAVDRIRRLGETGPLELRGTARAVLTGGNVELLLETNFIAALR